MSYEPKLGDIVICTDLLSGWARVIWISKTHLGIGVCTLPPYGIGVMPYMRQVRRSALVYVCGRNDWTGATPNPLRKQLWPTRKSVVTT